MALVATGLVSVAVAEEPDATLTITTPGIPGGVAVDASGSLYIASVTGGTVYVYPAGAKTPIRTLQQLKGPNDVAIEPLTGDVFVSDEEDNTVAVFSPGASDPKRTLTGVTTPRGLAFDSASTLYVSTASDGVQVFPHGAILPVRKITVQDEPRGLEINPVNGLLYVTSAAATSTIVWAFDPGSGIVMSGQQLTGIVVSRDIAFSKMAGMAYVTSALGIVAVPFGSTTPDPARALTGASGPRGIAVSPVSGDIFVADRDAHCVLVYPARMSVSAVAPTVGPRAGGTAVTITGANVGLVSGVTFGGVPASQVTVVSPTLVTAVAPAHAGGVVDVSVSWGSKVAVSPSGFTYADAPGKAQEVRGAPGSQMATIMWSPPADAGGVSITEYSVTLSPGGQVCVTQALAPACAFWSLTNGQTYSFAVTTRNAAGLTSLSDVASVTPANALPFKIVKAKGVSYKIKRRGTTTLVRSVTVPSYATRKITGLCMNATGLPSKKLCSFTIYKSGKVKVRTKGYKRVTVTVRIRAVPKASAGPTWRASDEWARHWQVR